MLSDSEEKALRQLIDGSGGVVDRFGRVVIAGVPRQQLATATFLRLVTKGLAEGHDGHLYATPAGRSALQGESKGETR